MRYSQFHIGFKFENNNMQGQVENASIMQSAIKLNAKLHKLLRNYQYYLKMQSSKFKLAHFAQKGQKIDLLLQLNGLLTLSITTEKEKNVFFTFSFIHASSLSTFLLNSCRILAPPRALV